MEFRRSTRRCTAKPQFEVQIPQYRLKNNQRSSKKAKILKEAHVKRKKKKLCNRSGELSKENTLLFKFPFTRRFLFIC